MPDAELEAMSKVSNALADLDQDVRDRVLRWAGERYGVEFTDARRRTADVQTNLDEDRSDADDEDPGGASGNSQEYAHFAELYDAVGPTSDPERALVGAYWVQVRGGKATFGSQELNKILKDLGHGVGTINKAMSSNISKKPALILQVARGGNSQQARKKYKVTDAGIKWVKARLA